MLWTRASVCRWPVFSRHHRLVLLSGGADQSGLSLTARGLYSAPMVMTVSLVGYDGHGWNRAVLGLVSLPSRPKRANSRGYASPNLATLQIVVTHNG